MDEQMLESRLQGYSCRVAREAEVTIGPARPEVERTWCGITLLGGKGA